MQKGEKVENCNKCKYWVDYDCTRCSNWYACYSQNYRFFELKETSVKKNVFDSLKPLPFFQSEKRRAIYDDK